MTRRSYSREFKEEAVVLAKANGVSRTSRDLGVHPTMLHRWIRLVDEGGERAFPGKGSAKDEDVARLKRENERLREEVAILKKAVGIFSTRPR